MERSNCHWHWEGGGYRFYTILAGLRACLLTGALNRSDLRSFPHLRRSLIFLPAFIFRGYLLFHYRLIFSR